MHMLARACFLMLSAGFVCHSLCAQTPQPPANLPPGNYDEAKVGTYTLPDPLVLSNGTRVRDAATWFNSRRPEIVQLFEENQFGRSPQVAGDVTFDITEKAGSAFDGKATRRQLTVYFNREKKGPKIDLLEYLPAAVTHPVPMLLCINFTANSNMVNDPAVKAGEVWSRDHKKVPASQGMRFGSIDVPTLLAHGLGVAMFYYGDVEPDFAEGLPMGVRALFLKPSQMQPAPDEWGAIAAWGWGMSRVMDYLETDTAVDSKRVAIFGVSRLGKTVLWAGARDTRFALVIASCSGEGGAALSRRDYGETVKNLTQRFGYQFCTNYQKFGDHVDQLPVDAHMLISLIAPRPLLLQTGDRDFWSDPKGEFLAAVAAEPVYRLLGKQGLGTQEMPLAGQPILHTLGYYMHSGGHGALPADWQKFIQFLDMHLHSGE